jgi:hypothetical protein
MIPADHDLDALFKRLHLAYARRVWRDLVQRAERETWSYRDFLTLLIAEEIAHRQQTRLTASPDGRIFHFSRPSMISISRISRRCASPSSARRSRQTLLRTDDP